MPEPYQQAMLRQIPAVDQLLSSPKVVFWATRTSRDFVMSEIQKLLQDVRTAIYAAGEDSDIRLDIECLGSQLIERLQSRLRPKLHGVINATGIILHTNLGRAPLSTAAQDSLSAIPGQYSNLEYDLDCGERSQRDRLMEAGLRELLACEAAIVVNNNAAAVFLILNTLAQGKEVIVSRGELMEIGGSFRIPDILMRSGAFLREVGTTNKTRIEDYRSAIGPNTALLLRIHPSNYRMIGFTRRPDLNEMVALAREHNLPVVEDIGSGSLLSLKPYGITDEPVARESIGAGAGLICFSGDKLLGGPQAGIVAGLSKWLDPMRRNPLLRTFRVCKLTYAALEATLVSYRTGRAFEEIPVLRMITMNRNQIHVRAGRFARRLRTKLNAGASVQLVEGNSLVGGGSCPECQLPTTLIKLHSERLSADMLESRLRTYEPPVIARIEEDRVLLDLRTVFPKQEKALQQGILNALG
jgi:L-seryl-tRNA(Ser) seleniumtransferase